MQLEQSDFIGWIILLSRVSPNYCEPDAKSSHLLWSSRRLRATQVRYISPGTFADYFLV